MKCIRNNSTNQISRVADSIAAHQVKIGIATFAKKVAFKQQERPGYIPVHDSLRPTVSKLTIRKERAENERLSRIR